MSVVTLATRLRKVRRLRGSRTHGWGTSGQHRKSGMLGGHGLAGRFRHKRTAVQAGRIPPYGKHGFRRPGAVSRKTINLTQLSELAEKHRVSDAIDLQQYGYDKLLSTGKLRMPLKISVKSCSELALKKVESTGGKVILPSAQ